MASQNARQDQNRFPGNFYAAGSNGTAASGTEDLVQGRADAATGAQYVYNLGPAGNVSVAGTDPTSYLPVRLTDGTDFYNASGGAGGGTFVNIATGTQQTLGTVGVVNNIVKGTVTKVEGGTLGEITLVPTVTTVSNLTNGTTRISLGSVGGLAASAAAAVGNPVLIAGTDAGGTIYAPLVDTTGALKVTGASAGTFVNIVTGTQQTLGTVGIVNTGTLAEVTLVPTVTTVSNLTNGSVRMTVGTITTGSIANIAMLHAGTIDSITGGKIAVTVGTVVGPTASGGTPTTAPILVAGTDVTGTVYAPLVTATGAQTIVDVPKGTITLVSSVAELVKGTVTNIGTLVGVGTMTNLGSVTNIGTIKEAGTVTGVGVVTSVTNLAAGTITPNLSLNRRSVGTFTSAGQTIAIDAKGASIIGIYPKSTSFTGTIILEATYDDVNWVSMAAHPTRNQSGAGQQSSLSSFIGETFYMDNLGYSQVRGSATAVSAGSLAFTLVANNGGLWVMPTLGAADGQVALDTSEDRGILVAGRDDTNLLQWIKTDSGGRISLASSGTILNLATGTIATVTSISEIVKGTTTLVTTVSNLTNGSVNLLTGTVTSVTNLAGGTVQLNPVPVPTMLTFGTLGTAGGSFFGTISAASGAGTKHYVSGVDIVMQSGTADVRVLAGTSIQGTGVLAAGKFPEGGGISKQITPAFATGTNSELVYHFVGAGSAFITVNYWKGV